MLTAVQLVHKISEHQIQHWSAAKATKSLNPLDKREFLSITHPAAPCIVFKFLNLILHSIPGLDSLPPTDRPSHCWSNWNRITSDPWTLQVVKGYQLELVGFPYQDCIPSPPCWTRMTFALITNEVEKLIRKRAI